jgi:hypothetical protein
MGHGWHMCVRGDLTRDCAVMRAGVNVLSFTTEAEARARLKELPSQAAREFWMDHVYMFNGRLNEITDDGKMWNHSETPCTGLPPPGDEYCFESSYSIRDIAAGEELLDDYGLYEYPEWYNALCAEFGVTREFVCRKPVPVKSEWKGYGAGGAAPATAAPAPAAAAPAPHA